MCRDTDTPATSSTGTFFAIFLPGTMAILPAMAAYVTLIFAGSEQLLNEPEGGRGEIVTSLLCSLSACATSIFIGSFAWRQRQRATAIVGAVFWCTVGLGNAWVTMAFAGWKI